MQVSIEKSYSQGHTIENECISDLVVWETPITFEKEIIVLFSGNISPTLAELTFYKEKLQIQFMQ